MGVNEKSVSLILISLAGTELGRILILLRIFFGELIGEFASWGDSFSIEISSAFGMISVDFLFLDLDLGELVGVLGFSICIIENEIVFLMNIIIVIIYPPKT